MMTSEWLLDVNILLALAWPNHLHHGLAQRWFLKHLEEGWATCPLTELGFIRLSANPKVFPDAVSPSEAARLLSSYKRMEGHVFWADALEPGDLDSDIGSRVNSYKQVTDAHLVRMARSRGARMVTFDKGVSTLLAPSEARATILVLR